jgi:hypothetical protein
VQSRCKAGAEPVASGFGPALHRPCTGLASDESAHALTGFLLASSRKWWNDGDPTGRGRHGQ